ncbi:MAG: AMP-dependent synthetase/ligase [Candidatus Binatia bacterium]
MGYQSLAEMLLSQGERYSDRVLYHFYKNKCWETYRWQEVLLRVRHIGLGLVSLGVKKGDRVAILSANRVEWSLIDWANICIGALAVPIYSSSSMRQVRYIVAQSESSVFFVETAGRLAKIDPQEPSFHRVSKIILMESAGQPLPRTLGAIPVLSLGELEEMGRRAGETDGDLFDRLARSLCPEDDLTIIYTSGTTGVPKGVVSTHGRYLFMIDAVEAAIPTTDKDVNLQFLPLAHSLGRLEHFMVVAKGYTCGFARSLETVARDLSIVRPTILFSVPRIYENAYSRIHSRIAGGRALPRFLFQWGVSVGKGFSRYQREAKVMPWRLRVAHYLAHWLVFSKIHSAFGGRLRLAISGGAPLAPEVAEFFHALGILVLEGFGLTETSTVSHVNRPARYKFGSVGLPLPGVECGIGPDGEILLRGPNIFKGYYRDLEATRESIDADGWFHTGDIGEIDDDGFLRITDRKKDLIVTSGGTKVAPQMIEKLLKADPLISEVMVIGDRQKHLFALITLNQEQVREQGRREGLEALSAEEMVSHPWVLTLVRESIGQKNRELAPYEKIRDFRILPSDFTVEQEELTPTLKLRRQVVIERYGKLIENLVHKPRFHTLGGKE